MVMDWDRFSSHDYMGEVDIPLAPLVSQTLTKPTYYPLISKTGEVVSGDIQLSFSYLLDKK